MKKIVFIFSLVLFTAVFTQAQVVQSSTSTQTSLQSTTSGGETFSLSGCALPTSAKPSLSSEDLVIEKNVKISKVTGAGHGFWIEKNGVKLKEFATNAEAMGYVLSPGTYTAYPMLPKQTEQKAKRICVNIELQ